jgi:hypothetical protein
MTTVAIVALDLPFETTPAHLGTFGAATNTAGAALSTGGSAVATATADGWTISAPAGRNLSDGLLLLILSADSTGDTFTVAAGAQPPSARFGLGSFAIAVAATTTVVIALDMARHMKANGTIVVTSTDIGSNLAAILLPRGA